MVECKCKELEEMQTENDFLQKECECLKEQSSRLEYALAKSNRDIVMIAKKNKVLEDENNALKAENAIIKRELEKEKQTYIKMDGTYLWIRPNQSTVMQENAKLKLGIQRLREKYGEVVKESCVDCSCDQKSEDEVDPEALVYELQNRHQQDCVWINDLTTTISVLSGMYTNLRENVGMD